MKKTIAEHQVLSNQWHPTLNEPVRCEDVSLGNSKKFWWRCDKGHEWQAVVKNRSAGKSGCPYCANRLASPQNNLEANFPSVAQEWHPTKNGDLLPKGVTFGSSKVVWWQCSEKHAWKAAVTSRTKKKPTGCPVCSGNVFTQDKSLETKFPSVAQEWHPTKNGDLLPKGVTFGSSKVVWWQCSEKHEWEASISNRTGRSSGCPYCKSKRASKSNNLANQFPELLGEWDYELNAKSPPEEFTPKSKKKVWWKCVNGHSWDATIQSRANGSGCPFCSNQSSKPEMRILSEMRHLFSETTNRQKVGGDEIDVFIPSLKVGVEFDGSFYHKGKVEKDLEKNKRLHKQGIKVIRMRHDPLQKIWEHDVVIDHEEPTKKDLNLLVRGIFSWLELTRPIYIDDYLGLEDFANEDTYKAYISYFPNPLPEFALSSTNPEIAKEWDDEKNYPLTPDNLKAGSNQKVWWLCDSGHSYETTIISRTTGHGCPYCSGNAVSIENSLSTVSQDLLSEFDVEKNHPLTPSDVSLGSTKKIWWKCASGHEWQAEVVNRTKQKNPTGCPYCAKKKATAEYNLSVVYPDLIKEWDAEKNKTINPSQLLPKSGKSVWWKCKKGHSWEAKVYSRASGTGCPVCYRENIKNQKTGLIDVSKASKSLTRARPVKCIDTGETFFSASAAERVMRSRGYKVNSSKILLCCKGIRSRSGGLRWEWGTSDKGNET
jgi:very-short-patch-repair endonuclease